MKNNQTVGFRYYKNLLNKDEQHLYDIVAENSFCFRHIFFVRKNFDININKIIRAVLMDNPKLFFIDGYYITQIGSIIIFRPKFNDRRRNILSKYNRIENLLNGLTVFFNTKDTYNIVFQVHGLLCRKIKYDCQDQDAHNIIGGLVKKRAVCDGISKSAKAIFDCCGIMSYIVNGVDKEKQVSHSWLKVYVNKKWQNLDITYDLSTKSNYWFLVGDEVLKQDRSW